MADLTTTPVLSVHATYNSRLSDFAQKDGQLIFIQDKHTIALDFGGSRRVYRQIEELATEEARTSLLAPVAGLYYFVIETSVLWTYLDGWIQITTPPSNLTAVEEAAKDYADEIGSRVTGSVDADGNYIIMFNENFGWTVE